MLKPRPVFGLLNLAGDQRINLDIRDVPRKALSLLYKVEPRIVTKEFYELEPLQRRIMLTSRRMLQAYGNPHEPQQIYGHELLVPHVSSTSPVFSLETHGNSRYEETWFKWLEASAKEIERAVERRKADQLQVLEEMDRDIENWLTGIGAMSEEAASRLVKFRPENGTWSVDWDRAFITGNRDTDKALRRRLQELASAQGAQTLREFLMMRPETSDVARALDEKLGISAAVSPKPGH